MDNVEQARQEYKELLVSKGLTVIEMRDFASECCKHLANLICKSNQDGIVQLDSKSGGTTDSAIEEVMNILRKYHVTYDQAGEICSNIRFIVDDAIIT